MARFSFDSLNPKDKLKNIMRPNVAGPKVPLMQRGVNAVGNLAKKIPFKGIAGTAALPGAMLLDRSNAPEDRFLPHFGEVADSLDFNARAAYDKGGVLPALGEVGKAIVPAVGGLMRDAGDTLVPDFIHNAFADFKGLGPDLGPGIEHTPGAAAAIANQGRKPAPTPAGATASATSPTSKYDDLLLKALSGQDQETPASTEPVDNNYFINHQTGRAPGEKQYFRDLPQAFPPKATLPQQLPDQAEGQSPAYESPLVAATENLNLPQIDASKDSYGDLLGKRLELVNEGGKLIPALARTKEQAEQQRQGEVDQQFGLDTLELGQDKAYQSGTLELGRQELGESRRSSDLSNIVRLRGQDVLANTRRAVATAKGTKPRTYKQQIEDQDSLTELSRRRYPDAPVGFAEGVPGLVDQGFTEEQIQEAYNWVSAIQVKNTGTPVNELDVNNLYTAIAKRLGGR